jgi:excinuclease ABC subunit A
LHLDDISKLFKAFNRLVDEGNSLIIVEHNLDVIANADWIIDLGPGPGIRGGKLIGSGTPSEISKLNTPTGIALRNYFKQFKQNTSKVSETLVQND